MPYDHGKPVKIPEFLYGDELDRLLAQPSTRYPTGKRNRALIAMMSDCGLRVSEALNLEDRDIDFNTGRVKVRQGKGKKDRFVYAEGRTLLWLRLWLDIHPPGKGPLFTTLKGTPLQSRYVRAMVKRYAIKAGIDKDVHPHTLRHTFAADLQRKQGNILITQRAMGHANLSSTLIYMHVVDSDVEDAMKGLRS